MATPAAAFPKSAHPMSSRSLLLTALLLAPATLSAQAPVRYQIAFPNAAHHEAEITVVFEDIGPGTLELRMSRTSPGRYALHEFAKNVYNFRASGAEGRPVEVSRADPHQWDVAGHGGTLRVTYTLFGDRADGTYTGIDRTHGHLNMPATFLWARGLEARPIELVVRPPAGSGWRVATQLAPTDDRFRFTAPDLAYFLDSPTEVSDFWERSWEVAGPEGPQMVRIALHHDGTEQEAEAYARATAAIVDAEAAVYGALPLFDHGSYTFLACYLPWVNGDGMEHRNSTVLTSTGSLASNMTGLLGTVAHEFFHAWNIERIRPASLEPFDFEAANMSGALWFGEGFTSYYTNVALWRAGLIDDEAFARRLGGTVNAVVNGPGREYFSPVEMSMQAPFVDAARSVDPQNRANTFISYYTWGAAVGLGMDLVLRQFRPGVGLDHVMREMWRAHGSPEVPYTVDDIEAALARVSGDAGFAADFFRRFVRGSNVPDYRTLLSAAGILLAPVRPGEPTLGPLQASEGDDGVSVDGATLVGTPLYEAGVDRGDVILAVGGRSVRTPEALERAIEGRAPGDAVEIRYRSRGEERTASVALAEDASLGGTAVPAARLDRAQAAFRTAWKEAPAGGR